MKLKEFNKRIEDKKSNFKNKKSKYLKIGSLIVIFIAIISVMFLTYSKFVFKDYVDEVSNDNIQDEFIAYYIDGEETNTMPQKGNYDVTVTCDKGATGTWDNDTWSITISNATQTGTRCSVSFKTPFYMDSSGASTPILYSGLIPIRYENNVPVITDTSEVWYDYVNHKWANAILIDQSNTAIKNKYLNSDGTYKFGTVVDISDVLQMYVWIPRYRYQLFNVSGTSTSAQMINIEFESADTSKSSGTQNGQWLTHPAFTFGSTELNGIWVGKFEPSNSTSDIKIIPNVSSLRNINISAMFNASRAIESNTKYGLTSSEVDTHMMKNMEWGAVTYLTYSKYGRYNEDGSCISLGCEVVKNNNNSYITGCAGDSLSVSQTSSCNQWNTSIGVNASTTGNIYGIYDMFGCADEYVMGNMLTSSGVFYPSLSGLNQPESKYYDSYTYGTSNADHSRGHLGDATIEVKSWPNVYNFFPNSSNSWFARGCDYSFPNNYNILGYYADTGVASSYSSFRIVIS